MLHRYFFALLLAAWSTASYADAIDIKGLSIGMSRAEVLEKFGGLPLRDFTLGGVPTRVALEFYEEKLDSILFSFTPNGFSPIQEALTGKYPSLDCEDSVVTNRLGATFKQTTCRLEGVNEHLRLARYTSNLDSASLGIVSKRMLSDFDRSRKERKKDI